LHLVLYSFVVAHNKEGTQGSAECRKALLGEEPGEIPNGSAKGIGSRGNGGMMEKIKRQRRFGTLT